MECDENLCACSGIRSCLLCERKPYSNETTNFMCWFCVNCWKLFKGDVSDHIVNNTDILECSFHNAMHECNFNVDGIKVYPNFITRDEETQIIDGMEKMEWKLSQSGRRKQDFGPQVNFKKQKVKMGSFSGFPSYSKFLLDRMKTVDSLNSFIAVELCNLEYMSERGSSIDPHIDDTWLWGEQLVTINLLSSTILTLLRNKNGPGGKSLYDEVQVLMPPRSLVILEKDARYVWTHGIKREHIGSKRVAMTFRNLSEQFLKDEKQIDAIKTLYEISNVFINVSS